MTDRSTNDLARLRPRRLPGRRTRKALVYEAEIRRLRSLGYTLDAIRGALADAGVHVSRSTVHREAVRQVSQEPATGPDADTGTDPSPLHRVTPGHWFTAFLTRIKGQP